MKDFRKTTLARTSCLGVASGGSWAPSSLLTVPSKMEGCPVLAAVTALPCDSLLCGLVSCLVLWKSLCILLPADTFENPNGATEYLGLTSPFKFKRSLLAVFIFIMDEPAPSITTVHWYTFAKGSLSDSRLKSGHSNNLFRGLLTY